MSQQKTRRPRFPAERPLAFVDVETTGGNAQYQRIIEIAIMLVEGDNVTESWSTLVNPERPIPPMISDLTGITEEDVEDAPTFDSIAQEVLCRLQGRVFVAHNARFDYAFVKSELQRAGQSWNARTLCTVKLSRLLHPRSKKHSLDALIARHGIICSSRHRAEGDVQALVEFWKIVRREFGTETIAWTIDKLLRHPALPPGINPKIVDRLPEGPGVYLFYGKGRHPLYIGKSVNIRQRVFSHFCSDHESHKEMRLNQEVTDIEWRETAGELGALLLEARLVKSLVPVYNRLLRRTHAQCVVTLARRPDGRLVPMTLAGEEIDPSGLGKTYGVFKGKKSAGQALLSIAEEHGLCPGLLELESHEKGRACFGWHLGKCKGACAGEMSIEDHNLLLKAALAGMKHKNWPFKGPVGFKERSMERKDRMDLHLFDQWCYLGTATNEEEAEDIMQNGNAPDFEIDFYRIIAGYLRSKNLQKTGRVEIIALGEKKRRRGAHRMAKA